MSCSRGNLKRLLAPKSIAFVGGFSMANAARRSVEWGYAGKIYLVNPKMLQIDGVETVPNIDALPAGTDAVFLGVNSSLTTAMVPALSARDTGGVVCYASGFAEMGPDGKDLQAQLVESAKSMALVGPNCYGLVNCLDGVALWPVAHGAERVTQGAVILTQSGNFAYNLSMIQSQFPIAYMASVGNQAQLGVAELIDAMLDDPRVTAIGLHLEGLKNVPGFAAAAYRALERNIPIVALKTGVSEKGAGLALGHTSSLAGSDTLYNALFDRLGIMRVSGVAAFIDTLKAATIGRRPTGLDVFGLACSGGDAGFIADHADAAGLALPDLQPETKQVLKQLLPSFAQLSNPLDFTTAVWGDAAALSAMLDGILRYEKAETVLLALDFPSEASGETQQCRLLLDLFVQKLTAAGRTGVVASVFPGLLPDAEFAKLLQSGIPAFQGLEQALTALGKVSAHQVRRPQLLALGEAGLGLICRDAPAQTFNLDEWESRQALQSYGAPFGDARRCKVGNAVVEAAGLKYPLVLKAISRELPHKTEAGGVALNLRDEAALAAAIDKMRVSLANYKTSVVLEEVLLESMAPPIITELMVGIKREPGFGFALVLAAGGVMVEILRDSRNLLLPTNAQAIRDALMSLRIAPMLRGFRRQPGADIDAAVEAILAVTRYATEHADRLVELEINPLLLHEKGCTAVDALVVMETAGTGATT